MKLPDDFLVSIKPNFNDEAELQNFVDALQTEAPTSIRVHALKWKNDESLISKVPWCNLGFYLDRRPVFTLDPVFHAGGYYVQEASSMFLWHILNQLNLSKEHIKVLDLSAAPGGKSTLIASWLDGKGLLVANEVVKSRAYTLKYNLMKEDYDNCIVSNNSPDDFKELSHYFDVILVDVPCSGEGMFRKNNDSIHHWSLENVMQCSIRQKNILDKILPSLKADGILIYSTCTYNHLENIQNCEYIVSRPGIENISININSDWGISEIQGKDCVGYQFYPHMTRGEGFFISVFKNTNEKEHALKLNKKPNKLMTVDKKERKLVCEWVEGNHTSFYKDIASTIHAFPSNFVEDILHLEHYLRVIYCGVSIGRVNKNILIPDHSLALSKILHHTIPKVELDRISSLQYLNKTLPRINSDQKSWIVATYQGLQLGFLKNIGDRINNCLPNEYKILMKLPDNLE